MRFCRAGLGPLLGLLLAAIPTIASAEFCWKDTYGRGVGTLPNACAAGEESENGLCYKKCPSGYAGEGPVCWKSCPSGFTDSGVACTKSAPYGRGAGYPWKLGDKIGSLDEARARCAKANPQGCEKAGEIIYPKCRAGYKAVGSNICSPVCPTGYKDTGATCLKPTQTRGAGTIPGCPAGKVSDGGLCYDACKNKYDGKGPVCWQQCPPSIPHTCGAGCVSTKRNPGAPSRGPTGTQDECTRVIAEQVLAVLEVAESLALAVATGGTASLAKNVAVDAVSDVVIKGSSRAAVKAAIKSAAEEAGQKFTDKQLENLTNMAMGSDFDPYSLDPTGISAVVKAFNHGTCPVA